MAGTPKKQWPHTYVSWTEAFVLRVRKSRTQSRRRRCLVILRIACQGYEKRLNQVADRLSIDEGQGLFHRISLSILCCISLFFLLVRAALKLRSLHLPPLPSMSRRSIFNKIHPSLSLDEDGTPRGGKQSGKATVLYSIRTICGNPLHWLTMLRTRVFT